MQDDIYYWNTFCIDIYIVLYFIELYSDLQVDEKENDGKLCFDTFDLTAVMNCSALMASTYIEQDNPVTSENGNFYLITEHNYFFAFYWNLNDRYDSSYDSIYINTTVYTFLIAIYLIYKYFQSSIN